MASRAWERLQLAVRKREAARSMDAVLAKKCTIAKQQTALRLVVDCSHLAPEDFVSIFEDVPLELEDDEREMIVAVWKAEVEALRQEAEDAAT